MMDEDRARYTLYYLLLRGPSSLIGNFIPIPLMYYDAQCTYRYTGIAQLKTGLSRSPPYLYINEYVNLFFLQAQLSSYGSSIVNKCLYIWFFPFSFVWPAQGKKFLRCSLYSIVRI